MFALAMSKKSKSETTNYSQYAHFKIAMYNH